MTNSLFEPETESQPLVTASHSDSTAQPSLAREYFPKGNLSAGEGARVRLAPNRSEKITEEFEKMFLSEIPEGEKLPAWWRMAAWDRDFTTGGRMLAQAIRNVDSAPVVEPASNAWWSDCGGAE